MKQCSKCHEHKTDDKFRNVGYVCKECRAAYMKAWAAAHREHKRDYMRHYYREHKASGTSS
ncbi:hypothetical protein [Skermania sp. ID1734]|uniref:hypothetical protein n=1 Tax=Skermania sp. ID1734 TaxID=2597516 RepID=UPI001C8F32F1|nr:hypothetical protein [Skermania sp. ID1734]